jgi:hypothetical protein
MILVPVSHNHHSSSLRQPDSPRQSPSPLVSRSKHLDARHVVFHAFTCRIPSTASAPRLLDPKGLPPIRSSTSIPSRQTQYTSRQARFISKKTSPASTIDAIFRDSFSFRLPNTCFLLFTSLPVSPHTFVPPNRRLSLPSNLMREVRS